MGKYSPRRRSFLKKVTAVSAAGIPIVAGLAPRSAHAAYDPKAKFELKVGEVEFRRARGRSRRCSICTGARGTTRTAAQRSRWTARSRRAAFWSWRST